MFLQDSIVLTQLPIRLLKGIQGWSRILLHFHISLKDGSMSTAKIYRIVRYTNIIYSNNIRYCQQLFSPERLIDYFVELLTTYGKRRVRPEMDNLGRCLIMQGK